MADGLGGLAGAPQEGAPFELTQARTDEIPAKLLAPPPKQLGMTHASSQLLARHLREASNVTVTRLWKLWHLQPWRAETFKFSTDPEMVAKVNDIVGLYLHRASHCSFQQMQRLTSAVPSFPSTAAG